MGFWNWLWRTRDEPQSDPEFSELELESALPPLREFIYLDEVSLRSLLSSQKGALTDEITVLEGRADQAEFAASLGASFGIANSQLSSRFQRNTNEEQQVSRKAVVQSLFKEFRELSNVDEFMLRLNHRMQTEPIDDERIERGTLIEVEVELVADPIFKFSTVMAELLDLAEDYPEMAAAPGAASVMAQMGPMNRILQRLLVGLVPIRAKAVGLAARPSTTGGYQIVQSNELLAGDLEVQIVGVSEQKNYWQDVRRLLFSGSRFTMLCRVANDGVRNHWSAVKAADVLAELMPDFPAMLERVGEIDFAPPIDLVAQSQLLRLKAALLTAYEMTLESLEEVVTPMDQTALSELLERYAPGAAIVTEQRAALDEAVTLAATSAGREVDDAERFRIRKQSRQKAGLRILGPQRVIDDLATPPAQSKPDPALIETEIIAIYW